MITEINPATQELLGNVRSGARVLSEYEVESIGSAIKDCDRLIAKQGASTVRTSPEEFQQVIEFTKKHRDALLAMLAAGSSARSLVG